MARIDVPVNGLLEGVKVNTAIEYSQNEFDLSQRLQRGKVMNYVYEACKEMYPEFSFWENQHILEKLAEVLAYRFARELWLVKNETPAIYFPHMTNRGVIENEIQYIKTPTKEDI